MAQIQTAKKTLITNLHPIVDAYTGFRQEVSFFEAKCALHGQPLFSHLLLPTETEDKFVLVFVGKEGKIEHNFIKVVDREEAIFRNGAGSPLGSLVKIIRYVMSS